MNPHVVLIDNHDSFVYNLVDALAGYNTTVFRNTVPVEEVLAAQPDIIILSPGPGHPRDAGSMMQLIDASLGRIPILGICLGFQALLEHCGGTVKACGPVHGSSVPTTLTDAGAKHPLFQGLTTDSEPDNPNYVGRLVPVARYHSLGCANIPAQMRSLAETDTNIGPVTMAAETLDGMALGLQFHPESVLTPTGPIIIERCIKQLSSLPTMEGAK
ncbi:MULTISPECIES: anthranilate synthase component II [unclassified Corynebacterium]|uniref:anthranilate synthase component II n=1 Tax=unclassified Corynebacterium TaxID=2624378 RepID=UPI0008A64CC5|nr:MULTISPECIES: anthranilate synthase component II [unclassified Corynebacterium]OFL24027.1 glutamine amidotransferase [Corynebacterium sp. HMSC062A03]OFT66945.1 anthranilate synthase component 2 [Corynebacterium sp. HMSC05D03]